MKFINKNNNAKAGIFVITILTLFVLGMSILNNSDQTKLAGSSSITSGKLTFIQQLETLLRKDISASISVVAKDAGEVDVNIQNSTAYPFLNGATIRFKNEGSPEALIKNLLDAIAVQFPNNMALGKKLLSVDMRFEDKVYFGFEE